MITSTHKLVGAFRLDGKMLQYVLIVGTGSKKIKPIVYHIPSFSHCFIIILPWFTIIVPWFIMVYHGLSSFSPISNCHVDVCKIDSDAQASANPCAPQLLR